MEGHRLSILRDGALSAVPVTGPSIAPLVKVVVAAAALMVVVAALMVVVAALMVVAAAALMVVAVAALMVVVAAAAAGVEDETRKCSVIGVETKDLWPGTVTKLRMCATTATTGSATPAVGLVTSRDFVIR
ncbi:hypothetical protein F7725_005348 [Dissostichus mawsoni]|uniref:Uncharacterized protein n=1 Tax=Dissostichus mawsoni TaxID=36200 RepID=A0A7J5YS55_DISMA|nr:hypothetical protein F7725_005348 [Dissostichus mawsoni]